MLNVTTVNSYFCSQEEKKKKLMRHADNNYLTDLSVLKHSFDRTRTSCEPKSTTRLVHFCVNNQRV